jgi:hypothetical protein
MLAAAWVTAIATGLIALLTLPAAVIAIQAFRKQTEASREQAEASRLQVEALREAQANQISSWYEPSPGTEGETQVTTAVVHISNRSAQPVYDVELSWQMDGELADEPDRLVVLPPDSDVTTSKAIPPGKSPGRFGTVLRFRDAQGIMWLRDQQGRLVEEEGSPPPQAL